MTITESEYTVDYHAYMTATTTLTEATPPDLWHRIVTEIADGDYMPAPVIRRPHDSLVGVSITYADGGRIGTAVAWDDQVVLGAGLRTIYKQLLERARHHAFEQQRAAEPEIEP